MSETCHKTSQGCQPVHPFDLDLDLPDLLEVAKVGHNLQKLFPVTAQNGDGDSCGPSFPFPRHHPKVFPGGGLPFFDALHHHVDEITVLSVDRKNVREVTPHSVPVVTMKNDFCHRIEARDNPVPIDGEDCAHRSLEHVSIDRRDHPIIRLHDLANLLLRVQIEVSAEITPLHQTKATGEVSQHAFDPIIEDDAGKEGHQSTNQDGQSHFIEGGFHLFDRYCSLNRPRTELSRCGKEQLLE